MIPLVGLVKELRDQKAIVDRVAAESMKEQGVKIKYLVGTMIEVPRGAVTADEIAQEAQFFSFGTNDLTQLTFGFSRDDAGKFLRVYQEKKILERDPFASIDTVGVGAARAHGVEKGRKARPRPQARHLRRARRRPVVDPLLRQGGARLRELLAVPRARRAPGGRAGGAAGQGGRLSDGLAGLTLLAANGRATRNRRRPSGRAGLARPGSGVVLVGRSGGADAGGSRACFPTSSTSTSSPSRTR